MERQLDDWISSYLGYVEDTEPPKLYHEWTAVSCIAAAMERKCSIDWGKQMVWYPNFYIALVGPSGKARKGTAMSIGEAFIRELDVNVASEAVTREALIRELNNSEQLSLRDDGKNIPHSSLTVFSKELTVFLGYNNQQLMMDLTDWYDCAEDWTYRTKTQGVDEIVGVWLNLLGATTPHLIKSSLPEDSIGGGFTSRIIFVYEEDKGKLVPDPWETEEDLQLKEDLTSDLQQINKLMGKYKFTSDFRDRYVEWYKKIQHDPPINHHLFTGYNQRRPNHTVKLTMIMSASRRDDMVLTERDFEDACDLLQRTEQKMPKTFLGVGYSDKSQITAQIMDYVAKEKVVTEQDLMMRFHQDVGSLDDMRKIIHAIRASGFLKKGGDNEGRVQIKFNEDSQAAQQFLNGRQ